MEKQLDKKSNSTYSTEKNNNMKETIKDYNKNRVPTWSKIIRRYKLLAVKKLFTKSFIIHSIIGLSIVSVLYVLSSLVLPFSPFFIFIYVLIQSRFNNINKFESFHFGLISSLFFCAAIGLLTHLTIFNIFIMMVYIISITMLSVVYNDIGNY